MADTTICDRCGVTLTLGAWPFCPHEPYHGTVVGDDIPGGYVQENFGPTPEVFYSKQAMAKRAKELGLVPFVRWAGPHDRHVSRWASVDLDAATALVSRPSGGVGSAGDVACETFQFAVREVAE